MHRLYIQRRKLPKDTFFFGLGKKKFNLKDIYLYYVFLIFTILKFEQRQLLLECIETYSLKTDTL